jgi:hypothetical protein
LSTVPYLFISSSPEAITVIQQVQEFIESMVTGSRYVPEVMEGGYSSLGANFLKC